MSRTARIRNVYLAYPGARASDEERLRQHEDNLTKALVNTLVHGGPKLRQAILALCGVQLDGDLGCAMQTDEPSGVGVRHRRQRVLLGIVPPGVAPGDRAPAGSRPSSTGRRRPDAWLWGRGFSVLVEAKVEGALDDEQWRDHGHWLRGDGGAIELREIGWPDVHRALGRALPELDRELDRWLARQLRDYLEYTHMAGFTGLESDFFDYFHDPGDEETRLWVRDTFDALAHLIRRRLSEVDAWYVDVDVGRLEGQARDAWMAFGAADKVYRQYAHLTLSAGADGLELKVNVELKAAVQRLRSVLREDPVGLRAALASLPADSPISIVVEERTEERPRVYRYEPRAIFALPTILDPRVGEASFSLFATLIGTIPLPYVTIGARIPRTVAEALSTQDDGTPLVDEIVDRMKALHPLVALINGTA